MQNKYTYSISPDKSLPLDNHLAGLLDRFPLHDRNFNLQFYQRFKHLMDVLLICLSAPIWLPTMLLVALLIKLDSPKDPVFFLQTRTGKGGRRFGIYKFRTMVVNDEAFKAMYAHLNELQWPDFKITNDPRITRVGRFLRRTSLDELPQLLNVLKGDMSLVGPRPTSFSTDIYSLSHTEYLDVLPGLTGLWQILGGGETEFNEQLRLDLLYIERRSLALDIYILLSTVWFVVHDRNRNPSTMLSKSTCSADQPIVTHPNYSSTQIYTPTATSSLPKHEYPIQTQNTPPQQSHQKEVKGANVVRHTDISYPQRVWQQTQRFHIIVRLTIQRSRFSVLAEELVLVENSPVRVHLHSRAFENLNSPEQEILLLSDQDSDPIVFDLRPIELGKQVITLDFLQNGNPVGVVKLDIEITNEETAITTHNLPTHKLHFQKSIAPAEWMLYVFNDRFREQPALSFTLFRSGEVGKTFHPVLLDTNLMIYSAQLYEHLTILRQGLDPTAKAAGSRRVLPPEDVERRMRQFGQNLWKELIPTELKAIYAAERDKWHDQTLLIVSDEPYLPWELLWPYGEDWEDPGPWCQTLLLTRWLRRDFQGNGHEAPAHHLDFQSLACLAPADSRLPAAQEERRFLADFLTQRKLQDCSPEPPSWSKLLDLLEAGGYHWLHAATHGSFYPDSPDSDSAIWLQDGHAFTPQDIVGPRIERHMKSQRPAFVFNACHAARQDWALTRLGGWANRLISNGAGLFLAPLWTVTDDLALEFSKALYTGLAEGLTVAEAVRGARLAAKREGDPTWLAYSVYAHPNARVVSTQ